MCFLHIGIFFSLPAASLFACSRLRGTQGARPYTTAQVWAPTLPRPCPRRLPARGAVFVFSSKIPTFYSHVLIRVKLTCVMKETDGVVEQISFHSMTISSSWFDPQRGHFHYGVFFSPLFGAV